MANQIMISKVFPGASNRAGDFGVVRFMDDKNTEWQLFASQENALNLLLAAQGAALASATQRREPPDPKIVEALKIRALNLTGLHTQTGEALAVLDLQMENGLSVIQRVSLDNLRRLVDAGQQLLAEFHTAPSATIQ